MSAARSRAIPVGTRFLQAETNHLRCRPTVPDDHPMSNNTSLGEHLDVGATRVCCRGGVGDIEVVSGLAQPTPSLHMVAARCTSVFRDKA
jgi:hypothetical protein